MINLRQKISALMWGIYGRYAWDSSSDQRTQDLINKLTTHLLQLNKSPDELVLDAGCGTGNYALSFAQAGFQVRGIDSASGMIKVARAKISDEQTQRLSFERLPLNEALPYDDGTFDHIVCVSVLQLLSNPGFTLSELGRLLKPQGHLTLVHFERTSRSPEEPSPASTRAIPQSASVLATLLMKLKRVVEHSAFASTMSYTAVRNLIERANFTIITEDGSNPKILVAVKH
jgi:ubiquinone/menaquinone biosynthesis C-methylase UbiE